METLVRGWSAFTYLSLASEFGDLPQVVAEGSYDHDRDVSYRVIIGVLEKPEGDAGDVEGVVPERDL